jgi:hypothetical protein
MAEQTYLTAPPWYHRALAFRIFSVAERWSMTYLAGQKPMVGVVLELTDVIMAFDAQHPAGVLHLLTRNGFDRV